MPDASLSKVPQLRSTEKHSVRRTSWAELFNDLVFTVIVAQLAQRLLTSLSGWALAGFFLLYIPVWWLWNGETHYSTRFDSERDVVHRSLGSLQLLGLIVLAATIPKALEQNLPSMIYALTYSAVRIILLIEYGRAWVYVSEARPYIRHLCIGFGLSILVWIGSAFVPMPYRYGLWILALCIELVTPLTSSGGRLHNALPPDVRHLPERYGLFTLILLGQTVSSAAQGLIKGGFETNTVLATLLGGFIIIGLWWAYFDRLDDDAVRQVSAGKSTRPYTIWLYLHLPLTVALTMAGVGLTLAIEGVDAPRLTESVQWLMTGSVAGYFLIEAGISLTSLLSGPPHPSFIRGIAARFGLAIGLIIIRLTTSLDTITLLGITAGLILILILSDQLGPEAPDSAERIKI